VPAICAELHLHALDGVPLVNSRDVAAVFEKRHDNVLRNINDLEIASDLRTSWFRPRTLTDSYGREQPFFDLNRRSRHKPPTSIEPTITSHTQ
jgi:phage regulator Rha-like protein